MYQPSFRRHLLAMLLAGVWLSTVAGAADKPKAKTDNAKAKKKAKDPTNDARFADAKKKLAKFKVPAKGLDKLEDFLKSLRSARPTTLEEYVILQLKARTAAKRIVSESKDAKDIRARQAQLLIKQTFPFLAAYLPKDEQTKELRAFTKGLNPSKLGPRELQMCMMIGRSLEGAGDPKLAIRTYESFGKIVSKSTRPGFAQYGHMFRGAADRVRLINGSPLQFTGTKLDGSKMDLEKLRGKVVLVDYWATWCGPCRREFPNMRKLYTKYKDKGFEIVGVSIDRNRTALEDYMEKEKLPWMIVHEKGGSHPTVKKFGISGIPQMLLVNRKGVVISTTARGKVLEELLAKEFGAKKESKSEKK